jgi:hypothetical protein
MHQSTHALRARLANRYALRQRFMHGVEVVEKHLIRSKQSSEAAVNRCVCGLRSAGNVRAISTRLRTALVIVDWLLVADSPRNVD